MLKKELKQSNSTSKPKKKYRINYLRIILIISFIYFSITFVRQQLQINEYNVKINDVTEDIESSKEKISSLKDIETKVNDAKYIENVARDECGLVKPYEKIIIDLSK